ncbi:MAG TPA: hypothetical protein VHE81_12855 [Lacipirellulaceae bacterium]|nr:hypothetical protein [Lacipirellulaceae bacterium]
MNALPGRTNVEVENAQSVGVESMSLSELADHIENIHHAYLLEESPRLATVA